MVPPSSLRATGELNKPALAGECSSSASEGRDTACKSKDGPSLMLCTTPECERSSGDTSAFNDVETDTGVVVLLDRFCATDSVSSAFMDAERLCFVGCTETGAEGGLRSDANLRGSTAAPKSRMLFSGFRANTGADS